jgi:hypothetical protein
MLAALPCLSAAVSAQQDWKADFERQLPYLGHRNWILIVDKAYPAQSAEGIDVFYTNDDIRNVTPYVLEQIDRADHIRPVIYTDKELEYMTDRDAAQVESLKNDYNELFGSYPRQSILHGDVFPKIDSAARQFSIIILKTNTLIPYSSVFIELDCGYWDTKSEQALRERIGRGG